MHNDSSSKAIVFPWYDKAGFEELAAAAFAWGPDRPRYDRWRKAAKAAVSRHRAAGCFIELVTIKPERYRLWLMENSLSDSPSVRQRYILELSGMMPGSATPEQTSSTHH